MPTLFSGKSQPLAGCLQFDTQIDAVDALAIFVLCTLVPSNLFSLAPPCPVPLKCFLCSVGVSTLDVSLPACFHS